MLRRISTRTGLPARNAGLKVHCLNAASAAESITDSNPWYTSRSSGLPSAVSAPRIRIDLEDFSGGRGKRLKSNRNSASGGRIGGSVRITVDGVRLTEDPGGWDFWQY